MNELLKGKKTKKQNKSCSWWHGLFLDVEGCWNGSQVAGEAEEAETMSALRWERLVFYASQTVV